MFYIIQHIGAIIQNYNGALPLTHFLKGYYKQYPKLGSRDRRMLTEMAYSWYRCSKAITLTNSATEDFGSTLRACLVATGNEDMVSKVWPHDQVPEYSIDIKKILPGTAVFSEGITKEEWARSMLVQPALFIRIRRQKEKIIKLLSEAGIPFHFINDECISLPNGAKIDALLPADCYVVQDASSQLTGATFCPVKNELWLDCCAGAGGKSLLLKDREPSVSVCVSDIRQSILSNLSERFRLYGHNVEATYLTDVSDRVKVAEAYGKSRFDRVICDVPCSGSGTWARTPEQLYFFDPSNIEKFSLLQKQIAVNVAGYLKPGGKLYYITCSVFKAENEQVVDSVVKETGLTLLTQKIINGTGINADSMFIAALQRMV